MKEPSQTNQELLDENILLKQKIQKLEKSEEKRRQIEEELKSSNKRLKESEELIIKEKAITESVLESIPGVFYQIDVEGKFVRTNKNFQELIGKTENEMHELNALEIFEGEDKSLIANAMQKVFIDGFSTAEAEIVIINGKIPFYFTGVLTKIDNTPYLIGVGTDVSPLKEIEKNLRNTNSKLEKFNKMAVGREIRMIELKRKINILSKETGKEEPYDLSFTQGNNDERMN